MTTLHKVSDLAGLSLYLRLEARDLPTNNPNRATLESWANAVALAQEPAQTATGLTQDLAMIVRRLVLSVRRIAEDDSKDLSFANNCLSWLLDKGLAGTPLREGELKNQKQPVQEPVNRYAPHGWIINWPSNGGTKPVYHASGFKPKFGAGLDGRLTMYPVYTAPPQPKQLTDEQWQVIADVTNSCITGYMKDEIEAALLGEKP